MKKFIFGLFLFFSLAAIAHAEDKIFNVSNYATVTEAVYMASLAGGGTVELAEGTYPISANGGTIYLPSNVTLKGAGKGTVLLNDTPNNAIMIWGSRGVSVNVTQTIQNGAKILAPPFKVYVDDVSPFVVGQNVELGDSKQQEFNVVQGVFTDYIQLKTRPTYKCDIALACKLTLVNLVENASIENITIKSIPEFSGIAIRMNYVKGIDIFENHIKDAAHSIWIENAQEVKVSSNHMQNGGHGVSVNPTARQVTIFNNTISHAWSGIVLSGHTTIVQSNLIVGSGAGRTSGDGITMGDATDNVIIGNTIQSGACYGVWIVGNAKNVSFIGNIIKSNATTGIYATDGTGYLFSGNTISGNAHGIALNGAKKVKINDNQIYDNFGKGIFVMLHGKMSVIGNTVYGNELGGIDVQYTTNNIVKDNIYDVMATGTGNIVSDNIEW